MHIVALAWLFVLLTMALTLESAAAAVTLFVAAGVLPIVLGVMLLGRRRRASMLERDVGKRDDGEAEADRD